MNASILVDGKNLFLNPFMTSLTGNMMDAVARSLKCMDGQRIELELQQEHVRLFVDSSEIPIDRGHAQEIVGSLLRGLLVSLKGTQTGSRFQFIYER